jgi:pimeloyl-ACP methyl ester carboxylesterase
MLLRRDAPAAMEGISARCQWFATEWRSMFEPGWASSRGDLDVIDPDDALLADRDVLEPMLAQMREAARQGTRGYVEDWIAESLPWGFSPTELSHEVHIWWGDGDQLVSRDCAEHFGRAIKRSALTVLAGAGHLFPLQHWQGMLAALQ